MIKLNIMGKRNYKTCPVCGKNYPHNRKFFKRHKDETLHDICRYCEDTEKRNLEWKGELLKCHKCGEYLPVTEFGKHQSYPLRNNHDSICRKCKNEQAIKTKQEYSGEYALYKILLVRYLGAKERSKKKNLPFNITKEYLKELWDKQKGKCAISGLDMTFEQGNGRISTNLSIDQINPKEGYTIGNIQLVCMAINQMKSDLNMDEVYMFCEGILKTLKIKQNSDAMDDV